MVELNKKYQIGIRRFNVNWVGAYTLYVKETLRFLSVFSQTVLGPILTAVLFLLVISLALGNDRANVLGVSFIEFLAPGLIAMQFLQQAFSHSSSSILMGKVMGNIVDLIGAPLSAGEVTISITLAAVTRGFVISIISIIVFHLMVGIVVNNYLILIIYMFLGSFIMGVTGFIAGLFSDKFDHLASLTNFIIVPLSFLSGTFYSVERLPDLLNKISFWNPFFHIIDGFRYAFIGNMDGSIKFGIIYLSILSIIIWFIAYLLYKKGYKIKS